MDSIICPNCGEKVEISKALTHQFREQISLEIAEKHKLEIARVISETEQNAAKKIKEELEIKLKSSQTEAEDADRKAKLLGAQILELLKTINQLKDKDSIREIEMQKQLLKERERMEVDITKIIEQKAGIEKLELQTKLDQTKKALEDAQRKVQQNSQQLQGEIMELDLEQQLKNEFNYDEINPVPKGKAGADIIQKVCNKFGNTAGSIIWEIKRTKAWDKSWTAKLREDVRILSGDTAVLVSDVLPDGIDTFAFYGNIWVTIYRYALPLAQVLRISLLQVAGAKSAATNKDEKLEMLYQYLTDTQFKHRFEAQVETIIELRNDFENEQRTVTRIWKRKEMQLNRMMKNLASLYGEMQGILGNALPTIQGLDYNLLDDGIK
jgi:hypothetical protein